MCVFLTDVKWTYTYPSNRRTISNVTTWWCWKDVFFPCGAEVTSFGVVETFFFFHTASIQPSISSCRLASESSSDAKKSVALIGHSRTINTFFTRIGLFKDASHLTASNFEEMKQRQWLMSSVAPWSSNFALAWYSCTTSPTYRVQTFFNEEPIVVPGCHGNAVCSYDDMVLAWQPFADECDIEEMCEYEDASGGADSVSKTVTSATFAVVSAILLMQYVMTDYWTIPTLK